MSGWRIGRELCVVVCKRSRRGVLVARNGRKWRFRPHGYKRSVSVCPVRSKWRYALKETVVAWPKKLATILIKSNFDAFMYKKEQYGTWRGARCTRTITRKLPVWQVLNSNKIYVGHLGVWKLARSEGSTLHALNEVPKDRHFYIGRGKMTPVTFKCLKTACRENVEKAPPHRSAQLYEVPSREELG